MDERWLGPVPQIDEALAYLRRNGISLAWRCPLTGSQIEGLAAIVKNMLDERPADHESEIKDKT
jgi:hypothetical protein